MGDTSSEKNEILLLKILISERLLIFSLLFIQFNSTYLHREFLMYTNR